MKYEEDWKKLTDRIGFWLDMDNAYFTFKDEYIETVWWILKTIWDKDLLMKAINSAILPTLRNTPLIPRDSPQGYKEVEDYSVIVKFPLRDRKDTYLLVWTTTPWTLVSNAAAAVSADASYVEVEYEGKNLILVKDLLERVFEGREYKNITEHSGSGLVGLAYEPVYDYADGNEKAFHVIAGDYVSTEDGTGIVRHSPGIRGG